MKDRPSVLVAQPLYSHVAPVAAMSFTSFVLSLPSKPYTATVFQSLNMYVDNARNDAVRIALGEMEGHKIGRVTHVLFVDSDMVVPQDGLDRLLRHDLESVGGLYFGKLPPFLPVAFTLDPFQRLQAYKREKVQEVDGLGMGFTLVSVDLFRRMRAHFKDDLWFRAGEGIGEDVWFYMRLKEMSVRTYLDASVKCGHVGELVVDYTTFDQVEINSAAAAEKAVA